MKTFNDIAAQGEITIHRIGPVPADGKLPKGFTPLAPENGKFLIGHSETGHHHVLSTAGASVAVMDRAPEGMRILRAILTEPNALDHLRDHDTHETIVHEPGEYEFRIGREFDPYAELARMQAD